MENLIINGIIAIALIGIAILFVVLKKPNKIELSDVTSNDLLESSSEKTLVKIIEEIKASQEPGDFFIEIDGEILHHLQNSNEELIQKNISVYERRI